jgi:myo-inositol 2-dehydrogenase/D-chiro-inositol 1-dehydrogenase
MNVAVIGAGKMATTLMDCLDGIDGVELTAVCDIDREAAEREANPQGAAVFTDHEELFELLEFDVLFLAIPPFAYTNQPTLAAERGIDLFVEKPVGLTPEYAREIETTLATHDVVTSSGYVFRYDRITERAMDLIDGRTVSLLDGRYWNGLLASSWGNEMDRSGGDINVRATHVYDLIRYVGGDVARVSAAGSTRIGVSEIDYADSVTATMEHENGIVSHVSSSVTVPTWTVELDIIGDGFELHLDYTNQTLTGTIDGTPVDFDGSCNRYQREVEEFITACKTDDQQRVRSSYADATRTLELNWAVINSLESGHPVEL